VGGQAKKEGWMKKPKQGGRGALLWWWVLLHLVLDGGGRQQTDRAKRKGRRSIQRTGSLTCNTVYVGWPQSRRSSVCARSESSHYGVVAAALFRAHASICPLPNITCFI
jgi:hypothetical protein